MAAVVRGIAPEDLRQNLAQSLESIHGSHHEALEAFDGDSDPFEVLRPKLADLLDHRIRAGSGGFPRQVIAFWVVLILLATYLAGSWFISQHRWATFRALTAGKPGILVTSIDRGWSKTVVTGLRDPLADPTGDLLEEAGISADTVELQWAAYICLDPDIILRRAAQVLRAPPAVRFEIYAGRLVAKGYASDAWREKARGLVGAIPGILGFDDTTQTAPPGVDLSELRP
jgi:OOP family OmpA-OmpF porin